MLQQYLKYGRLEAGCDEAGRGCLAGPVFAAAVILPENYVDEYLNDSKKLSEHQRDKLRPTIERDALAWAVGIVTPQEATVSSPIPEYSTHASLKVTER